MKKKEADGVKEEDSDKKLPQKTVVKELDTKKTVTGANELTSKKTTTGRTNELATKKKATEANELATKKTPTGFTPSWRERLNK